jgi:SnoaL-like domain
MFVLCSGPELAKEKRMTTPQDMMALGSELVRLCNEGKESELHAKHYAPTAVSVEAAEFGGGMSAESKGLEAIRAKGEWWLGAHDVHSAKAEGPFVHGGDRFSVIFEMDVTRKEDGQRLQMKEVGVYHVKKGKIVREEFFYPLG